jgi:hypothetical protein
MQQKELHHLSLTLNNWLFFHAALCTITVELPGFEPLTRTASTGTAPCQTGP